MGGLLETILLVGLALACVGVVALALRPARSELRLPREEGGHGPDLPEDDAPAILDLTATEIAPRPDPPRDRDEAPAGGHRPPER